jgi:hypothetical protein
MLLGGSRRHGRTARPTELRPDQRPAADGLTPGPIAGSATSTERGDGVLELRPAIAVPASQAWFWTESWQEGDRRADADIAAGRTTAYDIVDDFMGSLGINE